LINNRGGRQQAAVAAVPAHEAVQLISSGDRVFVHGGSAVPGSLLSALLDRSSELRDVELVHLHLNGAVAMASAAAAPNIRHRALFVDATTRDAVATGAATYVPVFLSDVPRLFSSGRLPLDAALLHVSPPDAHGFCSLGVSVDCTLAAALAARLRIAQVNPRMPRTHGDSFIHIDELDRVVEVDEPLSEAPPAAVSAGHRDVGRNVAELVEDAPPCNWGSAPSPTPCSPRSATAASWASTARWSRTVSSTWSARE
jgi:4-hydroxybutyrate CoA-transferase